MTRQKITLQYKCRRCGARYYDPTVDFLQSFGQVMGTPSLMTTIHDCNDNDDKTRFGISDLIGCKVEKK